MFFFMQRQIEGEIQINWRLRYKRFQSPSPTWRLTYLAIRQGSPDLGRHLAGFAPRRKTSSGTLRAVRDRHEAYPPIGSITARTCNRALAGAKRHRRYREHVAHHLQS